MPKGSREQVLAQKARARARDAPILSIKKKIGRLKREGKDVPPELHEELAVLLERRNIRDAKPSMSELAVPERPAPAPDASLESAIAEIKRENPAKYGGPGRPASPCHGECRLYEVRGMGKRQNSAYQHGAKRCNTCRRFIRYDGHICPCCKDKLHLDKIAAKHAARQFERIKEGEAGWTFEFHERSAMKNLGGQSGASRGGRNPGAR